MRQNLSILQSYGVLKSFVEKTAAEKSTIALTFESLSRSRLEKKN